MDANITFLRRLGPSPKLAGTCTIGLECPDIFELASGDFAIIGKDITDAASHLPPDAGCGKDERIVLVPRKTLILAKPEIPGV